MTYYLVMIRYEYTTKQQKESKMTRQNTVKALIITAKALGFINESDPANKGGCFIKEGRNGKLFFIDASDHGTASINLSLWTFGPYGPKDIISAVVSTEEGAAQFVVDCYSKAK